jgi:hypothetical protein
MPKEVEDQIKRLVKRKQQAKTTRTKVANMRKANELSESIGKGPRYSEEQIERVKNVGKKRSRKPNVEKKKEYSPFVMQKIAEREAAKKED